MKKHLLFISLLPVLLFGAGCNRNQIFGAGGSQNQLPAWKEGYLDIHSINTGGNHEKERTRDYRHSCF